MHLYYSDDYVSMAHSIDATKKSRWIVDSLRAEPVTGVDIESPTPILIELLELAHDRAYIEAIKTGSPRNLAESSTFPWDQGVWNSELASCGGMIDACRKAMQDGVSGTLSCGFHHASRERGRSHCVFNGIAVAVLALKKVGIERILHIDVDAHCGGGTHSLLGTIEGFHQLDISLFPTDKFTPIGASTLDIVEQSSEYLPQLEKRLNDLSEMLSNFQLCIYYAGMDPHEGSAFGGLPGINTGVLMERDNLVFSKIREKNIPCAFALGGGYIGPELNRQELVTLHRNTIEIASKFCN